MDKKSLMRRFQQSPDKYWKVELFKKGWKRQKCKNCGKYFWALQEQELCNDSSCRPYEFMDRKLTNGRFDYFRAWDVIKKFFVRRKHNHLERYPVLCKWFPLYFTIAGIVDFYRMDNSKFVFEFPKNPVILLQPSLRFADIPQVGVSGRHWTCHSHIEQACVHDKKKGYWKDRTIDLDYEMLTKAFGIRPEDINFLEDVWLGPGAFGYSLEYHVAGLELGNAVFTEFSGTPDNFLKMKQPIVDMGAGLERFCWLSQQTPTSYDAVLGPVIQKMKKRSGTDYDRTMFQRFSKLSGILNLDETPNIEKAKEDIAKKLKMDIRDLRERIEPFQAIYAIADHSKTLAFAIADGGLPSNIGGGYNLRVILRRALSYIDRYDFPFDIHWVTESIAKHLRPMHPELLKNLDQIQEILHVEDRRYRSSIERMKKTIRYMIKTRQDFGEANLLKLYDSHGITPEIIEEVSRESGTRIEIPDGFYAIMTQKHEKEGPREARLKLDVTDVPDTRKLFYEDEKKYQFNAKVLKVMEGKYVILDQTLFYPRGGGQEPDHGTLNGSKVYDVEKIGGIVVHEVEDPKFRAGDSVKGAIDRERRQLITIHHTAAHLIGIGAQKALGPWVWQAGSKKDVDKAHLDFSHYDRLTEKQTRRIEKIANDLVRRGIRITKKVYPRPVAEKKFSFRIYQGAPVPSTKLRIVSVGNLGHQACGGTHLDNTSEVGKIVIFRTERPADGSVRVLFKAGPAAKRHFREREEVLKKCLKIMDCKEKELPRAVRGLFNKWKKKKKELEKLTADRAEEKARRLTFESTKHYRLLVMKVPNANAPELKEISRKISGNDTIIILFGTGKAISIFGSAGGMAIEKGIRVDTYVGKAARELGGNGGGRADLAQGTGRDASKLDSVIRKIRKELKSLD